MTPHVDPAVWSAFFADSPHPSFVYAVGTSPRFVLAAVNRAWFEATGFSGHAVGRALEELMPEGVVSVVAERLERCVREGTALAFEEELRFGDRARYWQTHLLPVRVGGDVRYVVGLGHDHTPLQDAHAALAVSEAKFRRIVENASDIIYRLRLEPTIGFDYLSPSIEAVTGYRPSAFYEDASLLRRLLHPEDAASLERTVGELRQDWGPVLSRWRHRDGSYRWMEARSSLVRDASGKVVAREGIARDVTAQRRRDEERAQLEGRLQQAQKLESLGVLAGGIAHDFNNLLTGILGHASLLRAEGGATPQSLEHARHIETAAMRAADLCRQMLAYAGKGRFAVRRLNVDELVRETAQLLKLSVGKTVELSLELHTQHTSAEADATQLQQVVMNLVLNAAEACEGKAGRVSVTTGTVQLSTEELASAYSAPDLPAGSYVFLEVQDNGSGMSLETQGRIFDPFFSTKFTGRGLGLSAVHGIVRGHSGALSVQSELERGTTFRVLLPATGGAVVADPSVPPRATTGRGLVLVVDDEPVVRDVTSRILEALGYSVRTANDGQECVAAFASVSESTVAVLMDLTMPQLDGLAAFEELRRRDIVVPVILMSGYTEQDAIARFGATGLAGFLQKPFSAEILGAKLGSALGLR